MWARCDCVAAQHCGALISVGSAVQHPFAGQEERLANGGTGLASYMGYIGPFKAKKGSCDMYEGKCGHKYWNDYPTK